MIVMDWDEFFSVDFFYLACCCDMARIKEENERFRGKLETNFNPKY